MGNSDVRIFKATVSFQGLLTGLGRGVRRIAPSTPDIPLCLIIGCLILNLEPSLD